MGYPWRGWCPPSPAVDRYRRRRKPRWCGRGPGWRTGGRSVQAPWSETSCMSAERFTLDTNILVYSVDRSSPVKHGAARRIIDLAVHRDCWLTLQAISEFYAAAVRKSRMPAADAAAQASDWLDLFPSLPASSTAIRTALSAAASARL